VCAVQHQADAERFSQELGQRLGKLGLELSPDQTRVIPFTRQQVPGPPSCDGLGVEFRGGRDRVGKPHLKRRTSRKQRRNSLRRVTDWCKAKCRHRLQELCRELNATLRGDYHYDGVHGTSASLQAFCTWVLRILCKWLDRRSQRRSDTWTGVRALVHPGRVERPDIVGRPPPRLAAGRA
jgi:hypothetical protein